MKLSIRNVIKGRAVEVKESVAATSEIFQYIREVR